MHIILRIVRFKKPKDFTSDIDFQDFITIKYGQKLTIGRSDNCEIKIDDDFSSSIHAVINFKDDKLSITDSVSKNGTKVNKVKIATQTHLYIGDVISIGHTYIHIDEDRTSEQARRMIIRRKSKENTKVVLPPSDFMEITRITRGHTGMPDIPEDS